MYETIFLIVPLTNAYGGSQSSDSECNTPVSEQMQLSVRQVIKLYHNHLCLSILEVISFVLSLPYLLSLYIII